MEGIMDITEIRQKSVKVEFQAKSDPAFLKRLQADPVAVLQEEGFDLPTAQEVASQLRGDEASVVGGKCDPLTCIITTCRWFTSDLIV
jgi:hypothetical protein